MYSIGLWACIVLPRTSHQTTRKLKLTDDDRRKHNATICYSGQALVVTGLLVAHTTCSSSSRGVSEWVGGMVVRWFSNMAAGNNNGRPCRTLALYLDTHGNGVLYSTIYWLTVFCGSDYYLLIRHSPRHALSIQDRLYRHHYPHDWTSRERDRQRHWAGVADTYTHTRQVTIYMLCMLHGHGYLYSMHIV